MEADGDGAVAFWPRAPQKFQAVNSASHWARRDVEEEEEDAFVEEDTELAVQEENLEEVPVQEKAELPAKEKAMEPARRRTGSSMSCGSGR